MGERANKLDSSKSEGWTEKNTLRFEEPQLEQTVVEHYLRLASQTNRLRFDINREQQTVAYTKLDTVSSFVVVPRKSSPVMPHWLIEIHFLEDGMKPLGIEVADHLVIGVTRYGNKKPDLDLAAYGANERGVSRTHIMLSPGFQTLSLIDLGSTNGTWIKGDRIPPRTQIHVNPNTIVSLGTLSFMIRIVATPSDLGFLGQA